MPRRRAARPGMLPLAVRLLPDDDRAGDPLAAREASGGIHLETGRILDVYKRQLVLVAVVVQPRHDVAQDRRGRGPVSYTHLDVYKRQSRGAAGHGRSLSQRQLGYHGLLQDEEYHGRYADARDHCETGEDITPRDLLSGVRVVRALFCEIFRTL